MPAWPDVRWWSEFAPAVLTLAVPVFGAITALWWIASIYRRLVRENRDLTARVAQAEAQAAAAEKANLMKSEFLARVSHELRTPMTGILDFAEMAMTMDLNQSERQYLDLALTSAEWLTHVLSDILDFSKIEASRFELQCTNFSFAACIQSAAKMVETAAQRKHLDLTCKIDPGIPEWVNGDFTRVRQVIVNLLDNAVRFTTAGSVVLYAGIDSETEDTITTCIAVADTGIGIPMDRQRTIFEPFNGSARQSSEQRGAGSSSTGGTGLGLSICRKLVEMMGGSIEVQSHVGAGSTFRFTATFRKVIRLHSRSEEVFSKLRTQRLSILIADEDAVHRRLLTKLLESAGHQICPASTGTQAAELFATDLLDLVLLSTQLRDADTLALAESMRESEGEATRTYIYALRPESDRVPAADYVRGGLDGCIRKPAEVEELLRVVGQVAGERAGVTH